MDAIVDPRPESNKMQPRFRVRLAAWLNCLAALTILSIACSPTLFPRRAPAVNADVYADWRVVSAAFVALCVSLAAAWLNAGFPFGRDPMEPPEIKREIAAA